MGNSSGLTIFVEDRIALKGRMDVCRILVATSEVFVCLDVVPVEIAKESFRVKVHKVNNIPLDDWLWEQLGLHQNYFLAVSEMVNSLTKSPNGKLVVFEKNVRSRYRAGDNNVEVEKEDRVRGLVRPISLQEYDAVDNRFQKDGPRDSSIGIKMGNTPHPSKVLYNSSNGEERKGVGEQLKRSNFRGARGRGRRKVVIPSSHGM
ncbi:hypothetical protein Q3G72_002170 [Acer saccharum]|nr:hypothetical protein Q3G72_002170 [Acer saccharum]